jgi:Tfp pilus assembly protein PilF
MPFDPLVNLGGVLLNTERLRHALANSQLGLNYFDLNEMDLAETPLKTAVQLDPAHFSHPQLTPGEIYLRRGDRAAAVQQMQDFLRRHPDSAETTRVREEIAELEK